MTPDNAIRDPPPRSGGPSCCKDAGLSIELVYDPELIRAASENAQIIELPDSNYVLLSETEVAEEISVGTD